MGLLEQARANSHSYAHYEETQHIYALEVCTQRVWDYARGGYVHRLIQGGMGIDSRKLVECGRPWQNYSGVNDTLLAALQTGFVTKDDLSDDSVHEGSYDFDIDAMGDTHTHEAEYADTHTHTSDTHTQDTHTHTQRGEIVLHAMGDTHTHNKKTDLWVRDFNTLLAAQLDSQKEFYHQTLDNNVKLYDQEIHQLRSALKERENNITHMKTEYAHLTSKKEKMKKELNSLLGKKKKLLQEKEDVDKIQKQLTHTRSEINQRQQTSKEIENEMCAKKEAQIRELRQENSDLKFHIKTMKNVSNQAASDSTFIIGERDTHPNRRRKRR